MSVAVNSDVLTVGGRIRWVRQNAKFNIKSFAQELGISPNYLSILEHGKRLPSDQLLQKIAEVGRASYQWLKDGEDIAKEDAADDTLPQNQADQAPDVRLFLRVLQCYQPKIFPETVSYILNVEPDTFTKFMDGEVELNLEQEGIQMLAKRLDSDKVVREMGAVGRFLTEVNTVNATDNVKKAIKDYLEQLEDGTYTWGEVSSEGAGEDSEYKLPDCTVEINTLTYMGRRKGAQDETTVFRFQYVKEKKGTAPDRLYGCSSKGDFSRYMEVVNLRLPRLKPGRKSKAPASDKREAFVFSNEVLYERFAECLASIQRDRESRSEGLAVAGLPSLLLLNVNQESASIVRDIQPLPPFAITSARKYLIDFDGDKLVNNILPPQLGEYPELHAHEYFLSFVHGIIEKDRDVPVLYPFYIVDKDQPNVTAELTQESRNEIVSNLQDPVEQRFLNFTIPAVTYVFRDKELYQIFSDCAKTLQEETGPTDGPSTRYQHIFLLLDEDCKAVMDNATFEL